MDKFHHEKRLSERTSCLVCSYPGRPRVKYSFQNHSIYQCPLCNLLFLYPQPTSQELHQLYNSEEYFFNTHFYTGDNDVIFGYADYFAERFNKQKHFGRIAAQCLQVLLKSDHPKRQGRYKLLEVGCGPGFFLEAARHVGFEVQGFEFNRKILRFRSKKNSVPIQIGDFESPGGELTQQYDCIVMLDVIEHFRNPSAVIQKAHKALNPGGLLVIKTVDSGAVTSRILGKRLEDFRRLREHLYFFNRENMKTLLRQNQFSLGQTKSVGHTFRIDHLLNRIALMYSMPLGRLRALAGLVKLFAHKSVYLNPHTKMIVYARKNTHAVKRIPQRTQRGLTTMNSSSVYYHYHIGFISEYIQHQTVMELGSGNGSATAALLENGARSVIGAEINPKLIASARQRFKNSALISKIDFIQLDIEKEINRLTKLMTEYGIEIIFSFNFLEHVRDDVALIHSLYDALPKGGYLISILPSCDRLFGKLDEYYGHYRRYDIKDIRYRYDPFDMIYHRRCGLIKALGWMFNKRNSKAQLETYWDLYTSRFFGLDQKLDNWFGRFLPCGGTLVAVHRKNGHKGQVAEKRVK